MTLEQARIKTWKTGTGDTENTIAVGAHSAQACDGERPPQQVVARRGSQWTVICHECGCEFVKDADQVKRARFQFCSTGCKCNNSDFNTYASQRSGDAQRFRGDGRSYVKLNGRHAHRVIVELKIGRPLVRGEIVHHINGNRFDNRPENLVVITQSEHIKIHLPEMRRIKNERGADARGESSGMAKLTNEIVETVRLDYSSGRRTLKQMSAAYGVHKTTLEKVVARRTWGHVP